MPTTKRTTSTKNAPREEDDEGQPRIAFMPADHPRRQGLGEGVCSEEPQDGADGDGDGVGQIGVDAEQPDGGESGSEDDEERQRRKCETTQAGADERRGGFAAALGRFPADLGRETADDEEHRHDLGDPGGRGEPAFAGDRVDDEGEAVGIAADPDEQEVDEHDDEHADDSGEVEGEIAVAGDRSGHMNQRMSGVRRILRNRVPDRLHDESGLAGRLSVWDIALGGA